MDEITADHYSSATFASLAMDGCDVPFITSHPSFDVFTEPSNHFEGRRLMVLKPVTLSAFLKHLI
jgi:hypothetical protein